jgi:hypothetical protein
VTDGAPKERWLAQLEDPLEAIYEAAEKSLPYLVRQNHALLQT